MIIETSVPSVGLAIAASLGSGYFLALMWQRRSEPTARPLVGLSAVLFATTTAHLFHVHLTPTHTLLARRVSREFADLFWISIVLVSYVAVLGLWTVFIFEYTGRGTWVRRLVGVTAGGLVLTQVVTVVLVTTETALTLALAEAVLVGGIVLVLVLSVVGIFLVFDESTRLGPLLFREALVLSAAAGVLLSSAWLFLWFSSPPVFTGPVLLSSLLFVFAIRHYSMFEALPVASVLGRDRVIDEMAEAVVVVGQNGRIQDLNPATRALFETDRKSVLGADWSVLFPSGLSLEDITRTDHPARVRLTETVLAANASEVRDDRGRLLGYLVVCQDVTDRRERERRLAVLNRFLVETVSERMDCVVTAADSLADGQVDDDALAELGTDIWTTTTDLTTVLTYVREIERGLATDDDQQSDVCSLVNRVADAVDGETRPTVTVRGSPTDAAIEPPLLESVLELLVAEGIESSPGAIELTVRECDNAVEVAVDVGQADSGRKLRPLSIQLARLTVESAGGTVSAGTAETAAENGGSGRAAGTESLVTVSLPTTGDTDHHRGKSDDSKVTGPANVCAFEDPDRDGEGEPS